jgi:hypothetical protein
MKETGEKVKDAQYKDWKSPDGVEQSDNGSHDYIAHKDATIRKDVSKLRKQMKKD